MTRDIPSKMHSQRTNLMFFVRPDSWVVGPYRLDVPPGLEDVDDALFEVIDVAAR